MTVNSNFSIIQESNTKPENMKSYLCSVVCTGATCYLFGGISFFIGSIFYYPTFTAIEGAYIGAIHFVVGCIFFTAGSSYDFLHLVFEWYSNSKEILTSSPNPKDEGSRTSSPITNYSYKKSTHFYDLPSKNLWVGWKWLPFVNTLSYVVGSIIFVIGSIYFLPSYYNDHPSYGCLYFIVGCCVFILGSVGETLLLAIDELDDTIKLRNLFQFQSCVAVTNTIGCLLFILGSYFFLPEFLTTPEATRYATHYFVVGSVFFILCALSLLWIAHCNYKKNRVFILSNDPKN